MPHEKHFTDVEEFVGYKPDADSKGAKYDYHYIGHGFQGVCYIDSEEDISEEIVNGECDLMIRVLEIRWYRTDNSGIFVKYPVVAYEYVKIKDED